MKPLTILKQALHKLTTDVARGEEPTSALKKVALEMNLKPEFIKRAAEGLNVTLHYNHFKTAEDRSTEFPTADSGKVIAEIFGQPSVKKTAAVSTVAVSRNFNSRKQPPIKEASNQETEVDQTRLMKQAQSYIRDIRRDHDKLAHESAAASYKVKLAFERVVRLMSKSTAHRPSFTKFSADALSTHGDEVKDLLEVIQKSACPTEEMGVGDPHAFVKESVESKAFDELVDAVHLTAGLRDQVKEAASLLYEEEEKYADICAALNPDLDIQGVDKVATDLLANCIQEELLAGPVKEADGFFGNVLSRFELAASEKPAPPMFKNTKQDNELRSRILQELLMTDPILKHVPVPVVIQAYEQVLRLAPHVTKHKALMAAQLRAMVEGQALGPHDANQLVETNMALLKQHQLLHSPEMKGK